MIPFKLIFIASLVGSSVLLSSCGKNKPSNAAVAPTSPALEAVFSTTPSQQAEAIHQARLTAKPGDSLTLKGRIMGNLKPFVEGRAAFILGDPDKITPCNKNPDDGCPTPWDACCDTPEVIKVGTATIQVVDAQGKVLKEPLENVHGLKPLSSVVVSGIVAPGSNPELLVLNAQSIQILE